MSKKSAHDEPLDPDTEALIAWCTEVEQHFVAAGASLNEAQAYIEENAEWFTELFFEGVSAEAAALDSLNQEE